MAARAAKGGKSRPAPAIFQGGGGAWFLAIAEKKRILLNNIFGVDIDPQAVEVTKLSLLLKVLEHESEETLQGALLFHRERALPDLAGNIKCGNALIGPDFYKGKMVGGLFDEEEQYRVNAFDWGSGFSAIMKRGGFDCVIGNPPYVFLTEIEKTFREYYQRAYRSLSYRFDLYGLFVEKSGLGLLRTGGNFGYIIPHTLLSNDSFKELRSMLTKSAWIYRIVDLGPGVFQGASNETMLLFFQKRPPTPTDNVEVIRSNPKIFPTHLQYFFAPQQGWAQADGAPWLPHVSPGEARVVRRIKKAAFSLGDLCASNQGLRTGNNEKYLSSKKSGPTWKPAAGGRHVARYAPLATELFVRYEPALLDAPRNPEIFATSEKIVVQEVRNITLKRRIVATLDRSQMFCLQSTNVINKKKETSLKMTYVLGVLNSTAANYYFRCCFPGNNHIPSNQLLSIPVPDPGEKRHARMVSLVESMLDLHRRLQAARTPQEKEMLQRQVGATDKEIDALVYELYGLTEEEIRIVEEGS